MAKRFAKWLGLPSGLMTTGVHLERLIAEAASNVSDESLVLDAGAGDSPYRRFFSHCQYEAADNCVRKDAHGFAHVHIVCDLTSIPVDDARYDFVLCTQVLEHVPRPLDVLQELSRVLKPGGRLWLSTPLSFAEHEVPFDFFRYTQYGLRDLAERAGLEIETLGWVQGYFGTLAYQLNLGRHSLPHRPADYGRGALGIIAAVLSYLIRPLFLLLATMFAVLDVRYKYERTGHCLDYYIIAKKSSGNV